MALHELLKDEVFQDLYDAWKNSQRQKNIYYHLSDYPIQKEKRYLYKQKYITNEEQQGILKWYNDLSEKDYDRIMEWEDFSNPQTVDMIKEMRFKIKVAEDYYDNLYKEKREDL